MLFQKRMRWQWPNRIGAKPLVDTHTVAQIHQAANAPTAPALLARREVQHMLLGERQSAFAGRGYEFAENRAYYPGDDARFINWRALARTGELYRKTFYEERRPQVWLIVDSGASMRFGTRVRLKLAQAAQLALFHLFLAQRHALACGGVIFDTQANWIAPGRDSGGQQALLEALTGPCEPLADRESGDALISVLQQCQAQLISGCIIIIYSDFQQLQAQDMPVLLALAQRHSVYARQLLDLSEIRLPEQGQYHFSQGNAVLSCDCADAELTARYQQHMQQRHADIADWFKQAGIEHQCYRADEDLLGVS